MNGDIDAARTITNTVNVTTSNPTEEKLNRIIELLENLCEMYGREHGFRE